MAIHLQNNSGKENYLKNKYIEMWIDNGILYASYVDKIIITLEVAKKCVEDRHKVSNGKNYPLLINLQNVAGEEKAAREYYSSTEGMKNLIAGAFIVDSYLPALLANIYLKINKPIVPARLFNYEESALKWLEPFKNQMN